MSARETVERQRTNVRENTRKKREKETQLWREKVTGAGVGDTQRVKDGERTNK